MTDGQSSAAEQIETSGGVCPRCDGNGIILVRDASGAVCDATICTCQYIAWPQQMPKRSAAAPTCITAAEAREIAREVSTDYLAEFNDRGAEYIRDLETKMRAIAREEWNSVVVEFNKEATKWQAELLKLTRDKLETIRTIARDEAAKLWDERAKVQPHGPHYKGPLPLQNLWKQSDGTFVSGEPSVADVSRAAAAFSAAPEPTSDSGEASETAEGELWLNVYRDNRKAYSNPLFVGGGNYKTQAEAESQLADRTTYRATVRVWPPYTHENGQLVAYMTSPQQPAADQPMGDDTLAIDQLMLIQAINAHCAGVEIHNKAILARWPECSAGLNADLAATDALLQQLNRFRRGELTDAELDEVCHNLSPDNHEAFVQGCREHWRKLGIPVPPMLTDEQVTKAKELAWRQLERFPASDSDSCSWASQVRSLLREITDWK